MIGVENAGDAVLMTDFLKIVLFSLCTAGWVTFLDFTYKPGEIFGRYGLWLTYWWMRSWRKKDRWRRKLLPPIGLCPYCSGFWWCSALFLLMVHFFAWPLWLWLPAVGLNYSWTKLLMKV